MDNDHGGNDVKKKEEKELKDDRKCLFCGKTVKEVGTIYSLEMANICTKCIIALAAMNDGGSEFRLASNKLDNFTPKKLYEALAQYVLKQDQALKQVTRIVYYHLKRCLLHQLDCRDEPRIEKGNLMLIGSTGVGKTFIMKTLQNFLGHQIPIAICDANKMTEAGYVGKDVESALTRLLQACDYDIKKAQKGIVFIDEIDKIADNAHNPGEGPSRKNVQQALLSMIEGATIDVPPRQERDGRGIKNPDLQIDTTNILFVVSGAFPGLDMIIKKRLDGKKTSGFFADIQGEDRRNSGEIIKYVTTEDLIEFGMIPEFVGRISNIVTLNDLDEEDLIDILTEPKNAIVKQFQRLFKEEGANLVLSREVLQYIAKKAISNKTGARGLQKIVESLLSDTMYDLPDESFTKYFFGPDSIESKKPYKTKKEN